MEENISENDEDEVFNEETPEKIKEKIVNIAEKATERSLYTTSTVYIPDNLDFEENENDEDIDLNELDLHTDTLKVGLKKVHRTGLKRKTRTHLVPRDRGKLKKYTINEIDNLSEFNILRYAILNGYFKEKSSRTKKVSVDQLSQYLRNRVNTSKGFKFNIPKKFRKRSVDAMLGQIPFNNLLLWCNACDNFKEAAMHLCMAFPGGECQEEDPRGEIIKLIGERCKECHGTYSVWTFTDYGVE